MANSSFTGSFNLTQKRNNVKSLKELAKEDETDDSGDSGGGTQVGLRGKDEQDPSAAMRDPATSIRRRGPF